MPALKVFPPLSLYVHLPWCVRKCPYCDFNSHALRDTLPEQAYVDALLRDLAFELESATLADRPITSIFIGGGTPSLFSGAAIGRLLDGIRATTNLAADAEITLEANPGAADENRFAAYHGTGVNRLSIGAQSFSATTLAALGRIHGPADTRSAVRAAQTAGFTNINIDLMFGLPDQTAAQAQSDIAAAIELAPSHISAYQLTIEPNTLFYARPPQLPAEDVIARMQETVVERLEAAGFARYEISAFARPGAQSRHNLNYWRFGDYAGIGAGAHGKLSDANGIHRRWKLKHPRDYMEAAGTAAAVGGEQRLDENDLVLEFAMNALRLTAGFEASLFTECTGLDFARIAAPLARAQQAGLLERYANRIHPSLRGLRYLNNLLELFVEAPVSTKAAPCIDLGAR